MNKKQSAHKETSVKNILTEKNTYNILKEEHLLCHALAGYVSLLHKGLLRNKLDQS